MCNNKFNNNIANTKSYSKLPPTIYFCRTSLQRSGIQILYYLCCVYVLNVQNKYSPDGDIFHHQVQKNPHIIFVIFFYTYIWGTQHTSRGKSTSDIQFVFPVVFLVNSAAAFIVLYINRKALPSWYFWLIFGCLIIYFDSFSGVKINV